MATPNKSPITCHILDSSIGKPASDVEVRLQVYKQDEKIAPGAFVFTPIAKGTTNADGRCLDLLTPSTSPDESSGNVADAELKKGLYKIIFKTKEYFESRQQSSFYPWVEITFEVTDVSQHFHIPLLISPFSYTTYRGS